MLDPSRPPHGRTRRAHLAACAIAAATAAGLAPSPASAEPSAVLFYSAPDECPSAAAVAAEGASRGVTRWIDHDGRPFSVRVDRTGTGYVATLDLGGGVSPRVFRASRCEELVSATVLALALAVNEPGDGEPFDAARPPDPAASETAASAAATTLVPAGQLASRDIGDVPSALPRSSAGGLRLDVAALMVTGVVGGGSYGMQAGAAWAWARWELRGGARFVRLGVRPEQVGALVTAPLDACLRRAHDAFEVAACARLEVGASANPDRSVAPWLAPGVVGRLRFGERAAFFGVDVELGAPLVHSPTLPVAEGPTLAIAVGMGARI